MFDSLSYLKSTFNNYLSERFSNPVIFSFVVSWVVINWKILLILFFSEQNIEIKIGAIIAVGGWLESLIYPCLSAIFYVIVMPYILEGSYIIQEKTFKRTQNKLADRLDHALTRKKTTEELRAEVDIAYSKKTKGEEINLEKMQLDINDLRDKNGQKEKELFEIHEEKENLRISCEVLSKDNLALKSKVEKLERKHAELDEELSRKNRDLVYFSDESKRLVSLFKENLNAAGFKFTINHQRSISELESLINKYNNSK